MLNEERNQIEKTNGLIYNKTCLRKTNITDNNQRKQLNSKLLSIKAKH